MLAVDEITRAVASDKMAGEIQTEFLFEARVKLGLPPLDVGPGPEGRRTIYFVKGGTFEGPRLRGRVVPDGGAAGCGCGQMVPPTSTCASASKPTGPSSTCTGTAASTPHRTTWTTPPTSPSPTIGGRGSILLPGRSGVRDLRPALRLAQQGPGGTKSRTGDGGVIHRVFAVK